MDLPTGNLKTSHCQSKHTQMLSNNLTVRMCCGLVISTQSCQYVKLRLVCLQRWIQLLFHSFSGKSNMSEDTMMP